MLDLSIYNLTIGRQRQEVDEWFHPVFDRGRGAAFVDTGFLKAIINDDDKYTPIARRHFEQSGPDLNFYTTSLVLAETVRQIAKSKGTDYPTKNLWFERCSELLIDGNRIFVCHPPRELIINAYTELRETRPAFPDLDLCDLFSFTVLDYAQHRRVFGFDDHFTSVGAQLEPGI